MKLAVGATAKVTVTEPIFVPLSAKLRPTSETPAMAVPPASPNPITGAAVYT